MKRIGVVGVPGGWSSEALADAVGRLTGFRLLIELDKVCLDLSQGKVFYRDPDQGLVDLTSLDALILKKVGPYYSPSLMDRLEILRFVEERGVPVFSPALSVIRVLDRLSCTVTLAGAGIPMPATVVTEDPAQAVAAVERFGKAVLKPLYTSKARGMVVVEAGPQALARVEAFQEQGNTIIYLQEMVDLGGMDLGVAFLGGRYLATYARAGSSGWHTSVRGEKGYRHYEPEPAIIELAERAQALFKLDFTCVDVALTPQGPVVFEVSAFGGFRGLRDASGIDAAGAYARYVLERLDA
ncbi:MAG: GAK system ATP-grasp enzyme [Deltaproteobacteria bacterium]|nr:GAK system ATP-grasp enzyme [Deltaproteobacteria bacterium]